MNTSTTTSARIAMLVGTIALTAGSAPPHQDHEDVTPADPTTLVDQIIGSPNGWHWAFEQKTSPTINIDKDAYVAQLPDALEAATKPDGAGISRTTVLIRLAREFAIDEALPILEQASQRPKLPTSIRYEIGRVLAERSKTDARAVALLDSDTDAIRAAAVDALGNRASDAVQPRLAELLSQRFTFTGTLTGEALGRHKRLVDYKAFWKANPDARARLRFLLPRIGEAYLPLPSPAHPVRRDEALAQWLWRQFEAIVGQDPDRARTTMETYLQTEPTNAGYIKITMSELGL